MLPVLHEWIPFCSLNLQGLWCSISKFIPWIWFLLSDTRSHKYHLFKNTFSFCLLLGTPWQCFLPLPTPGCSWHSLLLWTIIYHNSLWIQSFTWLIELYFIIYNSIFPQEWMVYKQHISTIHIYLCKYIYLHILM